MTLQSIIRSLPLQAGVPAAAAAAAAVSSSSILRHCQLFSSSTTSSYASDTRGSTAGELGDKAAQKMSGSGESAAGKTRGAGVEGRVADAGFVPQESNAVPDPDAAGQAGGVTANTMGDMADMVGAMFSGDQKRMGEDIADLTKQKEGVDRHASTPHSTAAEWPRGQSQGTADSTTVSDAQKTSTGEVVDKFEGTIPGSSPPSSPPDIDQNPPESVTAGPTGGYDARGGDTRPI